MYRIYLRNHIYIHDDKFGNYCSCHNVSLCLLHPCARAKIQAVVARGGQPDPDCPNDLASVRYRVSLSLEENELWEEEQEMSVRANVNPHDALRIMRSNDPTVHTAKAADPVQLVRDQLQAFAQPAAPAPSESGRSAGGPCL